MPSPRRYQEPCELRSRLQYLFETGEGTDCRILVEREEGSEDGPAEFNAHRAVLLASSVPLRMLLLQASSNSDALPTIRLKDVSPEAFAACLSYIYSGKIGPVTPANAVDIFIAADRLDLPVLRKRAEHYLPRAISTATVGQHLRKAVHAKQMQLVAFCSAFIGRHFDAFLQTTAFLGLPQSILVALLSSPEICVENEDKILVALLRWSIHRLRVAGPAGSSLAARSRQHHHSEYALPPGAAAAAASHSQLSTALSPSRQQLLLAETEAASKPSLFADSVYPYSSPVLKAGSSLTAQGSGGSSYLMAGLAGRTAGSFESPLTDRVNRLALTEASFSRSPIIPSSLSAAASASAEESSARRLMSVLDDDGRVSFGASSPSRGGGPASRASFLAAGAPLLKSALSSTSKESLFGASGYLTAGQIQLQLAQLGPDSSFPIEPDLVPLPERLGDLRAIMAPFFGVLLFENLDQSLLKSPLVKALVPGDLVMKALFVKLEQGGDAAGLSKLENSKSGQAVASPYRFLADAGVRQPQSPVSFTTSLLLNEGGIATFLDTRLEDVTGTNAKGVAVPSSAVSRYIQQAPEGYSFSSSVSFSSSRFDDESAAAPSTANAFGSFAADPWASVLQVVASESYSLYPSALVSNNNNISNNTKASASNAAASPALTAGGPLSQALAVLSDRGRLTGVPLSSVTVGKKPSSRRYGQLRLHPGGKACIGDPALAKLLGVSAELPGEGSNSSLPLPPADNSSGKDYRLFKLSATTLALANKGLSSSSLADDGNTSAAASNPLELSAAQKPVFGGDYSSSLQPFLSKRYQRGYGLVGSMSVTESTAATIRWDSFDGESFETSNAGKTIRALSHVKPSSRPQLKARSSYHDRYLTSASDGANNAVNAASIWSPQFDEDGNLMPQIAPSSSASASSEGSALTAAGFLKAAELSNPYRLGSLPGAGAGAQLGLASSSRAGCFITALPAVAVPLPPASHKGASTGSSKGPLSVLGLQDPSDPLSPSSLPSPLNDKVPLGFGVMTAGRWSWSVVIEESEALFEPLTQPFLEYLKQSGGKLPAAASPSSTASAVVGGSLAANARRVSLALKAAGVLPAAPVSSSSTAALSRASSSSSISLRSPSASSTGANASSNNDDPTFQLYSSPNIHAFEVAIALIPAGTLLQPSALKGSSLDQHPSCEPLFVVTNRGHVYARLQLPDGKNEGSTASKPAADPKAKKPALGAIKEEGDGSAADEGDGEGGGAKSLGPLSLIACGMSFGVSSHVLLSVDTVKGHVGLSIANTRPLSGPAAAEQAGCLAGSVLSLAALVGPSGSSGIAAGSEAEEALRLQQIEQLASALDGDSEAGISPERKVDPSGLNPASALAAPHNANHPFSLPAEAHTRVEELVAASSTNTSSLAVLHTPDALAGDGAACLHALVVGLPFTALFQSLRGQRRLPSGVAALQMAMVARDGEGLQATLLPPPLHQTSRDDY